MEHEAVKRILSGLLDGAQNTKESYLRINVIS